MTEGSATAAEDRFSIAGQVSIVTGASSGIGADVAAGLARAGSHVVACARTAPSAPDTSEGPAGRFVSATCDVTSPQDREALVRLALDTFGRIDTLVNCAGASVGGTAADEDPDGRRVVFETNTLAVLELSALVAESMREAGTGSIVNIASLAADRSFERIPLATYAASKAAVVAITRELASQYGKDGVRVNAIAPGFLPTPMTRFLGDEEELAWIRANTPLGRESRSEDLIGPIIFLASEASGYITGQTIYVDGGWTTH